MDFEDERIESAESQASTHSNSSEQLTKVSIRGGRRRNRQDDESTSSSVIVKGAGTGAWAVQDAGSFKMIQDECSYLCSTLLASRTQAQALEAALGLAQLLATRKTRGLLWKDLPNLNRPLLVTDESQDSVATHSSGASSAPHVKKLKQSTVLEALLDVLTFAGKQTRWGGESQVSGTGRRRIQTNPSSPPRNKGSRTKSARRKLKELRQQQTAAGIGLSSTEMILSQELNEALAAIFYFLSLDCTLSKDKSVACQGMGQNKALACTIRHAILQHGKSLQAMLRVCMGPLSTQASQGIPNSSASQSEISSLATSSISSPSSSLASSVPRNAIIQPRSVGSQRNPFSASQSLSGDSVSSVTAQDVTSVAGGGDPTTSGRRNRRRRQQQMLQSTPAIPEGGESIDDLDWPGSKVVPPIPGEGSPTPVSKADLSFASEEPSSFAQPVFPRRQRREEVPNSPGQSVGSHDSGMTVSPAFVTPPLARKLHEIRSRVVVASSGTVGETLPDTTSCSASMGRATDNSDPWISMLCLESINRVISGKDDDGPSCLEPDDGDQDGDEDLDEEDANPIFITNKLLGDSGAVPLLAQAMTQSLAAVCLFQDMIRQTGKDGPSSTRLGYWHDRIAILASLIDGACLFNKSNRRGFAEHDPFSFEADKGKAEDGLIFHILCFLHRCIRSPGEPERQVPDKSSSTLSGIRLLSLRTLTSLTHDNDVARDQMCKCYDFEAVLHSNDKDEGDVESMSSSPTPGIDVLARLVYQLEEATHDMTQRKVSPATDQGNDDELHRYDSTIFCLNTLSNTMEGSDVRRMLAEITVSNSSGYEGLWLQWLCRWLVRQTDSFRDAILGLGKGAASKNTQRELDKQEEERLVAAGNGAVLLACLMVEPEDVLEEPESTNELRNLILQELKLDGGPTSGNILIINTLKAFCNFYHLSLGDLSVAIVTPVKTLIRKLEEQRKHD